jgi:hypothetical protein
MKTGSLRITILIACFTAISGIIYSQGDTIPVRDDQAKQMPAGEVAHRLDLGFGFGIDYGGIIGVQVGFAPIKHLTLFATGGYYLYELGWNLGIKFLFIPKTTNHVFRPFLKGMYGSNSVITASGTDEYNQVYKGFTVGAGAELRFGKQKKNGFDFDLNVPLRTPEFWEDYNRMQNDPNMDVLQGPIPVAVSIGFHHEF